MSKKKVYCQGCRYRQSVLHSFFGGLREGYIDMCGALKETKHTYLEHKKHYTKRCSDQNKRNDCRLFDGGWADLAKQMAEKPANKVGKGE